MNRNFNNYYSGIIMKKLLLFSIGIVPLLCFSQSLKSQEVVTDNNIVVGTRALGMGGAQIAASEDVTAVINNPAALARIGNIEAQLGFVLLKRNIDTNLNSDYIDVKGNTGDDYMGLGTIGIAYPVPTERGSLVFAFAYNRVKDFSGTFKMSGYNEYAFELDDETWGGNETYETIDEGGLGVFSLAGAVDVSPNVSLGASIDVWTGSYKTDSRILRNDYEGDVSWLDITGGEDDISALSFKPSILYHNNNFRLGAFVRFPMTFHINQDNYEEYYSRNDGYFFHIHSNVDPYYDADLLDGTDYYKADYEIKAPMQLGMGFSLGKPGIRCFALDMVYENWEEAEFEDEYDPYYFRYKYRSSLNWKIGFEHKLPFLDTVGRLGYYRQPVTFKGPRGDDATDPEIDVTDERDYITFGLSKKFDESFQVDVAYAHGFWSADEGNRTDEEDHDRFYISLVYRLPETFR